MHDHPDRKKSRRDLRIPLRVEILGEDCSVADPYALNLSSSGICLQTSHPMKEKDRLEIRFRLGPHSKMIQTQAEVAWVTPEDDRVPGMRFYELGLHFVDLGELERSEIAQFTDNSANYRES